MKNLAELPKILESQTIQPSFSLAHVIVALIIFGQENYKGGIGRYRLQNVLQLTEGRIKSLIQKMKKFELIKKMDRIKGHCITEDGLNILNQLFLKIYYPSIATPELKSLVLGEYAFFTVVYNMGDKVINGIEQRDAAKIIGGVGATCLIYENESFIFPDSKNKVYINFEKYPNLKLKNNDVLIIGSGRNEYSARLATINAALTLINEIKNQNSN